MFSLDPAPQKELAVGAGREPRTIAMYDIKLLAADGIKNIYATHSKVGVQSLGCYSFYILLS